VRFEVVVETSVPFVVHVAEVVPCGIQDWRQSVGSPWTSGAEYRRWKAIILNVNPKGVS
jgi:hypothetical protein